MDKEGGKEQLEEEKKIVQLYTGNNLQINKEKTVYKWYKKLK